MKKFSQREGEDLKRQMEAALQLALANVLESPIHMKVSSNMVVHEPLTPEGDKFKVHIEVIVYPKKNPVE